MLRHLVVAGAVLGAVPSLAAAQATYARVADIPVEGALPASWDYTTPDPASKRVYVSHGTEVVVIDSETNQVVGRIADTPGVHGIAVGAGQVFVSAGRENRVVVADPKTLATLVKIDSGGANPDAITFDPASGHVWVFNHTGMSATEIDAATRAVSPRSRFRHRRERPGRRRRARLRQHRGQGPDRRRRQRGQEGDGALAGVTRLGPTGLCLDRATRRLFVGAGQFMLMMDSDSGSIVSSVPICGGTDSTWYDAGTHLAFSSCRDGHITVARVDGDQMTVVQTIETSPGSRTMGLDTATHRIYVSAAKPNASGARGYEPGTFHVLVYGLR